MPSFIHTSSRYRSLVTAHTALFTGSWTRPCRWGIARPVRGYPVFVLVVEECNRSKTRGLGKIMPAQKTSRHKIAIHRVINLGYSMFMKSSELLKQLRHFDREHDYWLYTVHELALIFPDEKSQQLKNSLVRQCKAGNLLKVGGGLYAWPDARSLPMYRLEHLIQRLRPRELSYISLESALSMHGWISQIPLAVLTVMTTGRSYLQQTAYGLIEWTHTEQSATTILNDTVWDPMRGCLIARPVQAYRDIRRVRRNLDLVITHQEENEVSDKI